MKEVLICASRFQLKLLEENAYFINCTFQIVPKRYYQLLNILVFSQIANSYLPIRSILMEGKHYNLYLLLAFSVLNNICSNYGINIRPRFVMMNFEKARRLAIIRVFPTVKVLGYFYHYAKALWSWASKNGLRISSEIKQTKQIILLF